MLRTRSLLAALVIVCVGFAAWTAWAAFRVAPTAAPADVPALPELRTDAVRAVLDDPAFTALVPLVPPIAPATVGNPNPFASVRPVAP